MPRPARQHRVQASPEQVHVRPGTEGRPVHRGHLGGQIARRAPQLLLVARPGQVELRSRVQGRREAPVEQVRVSVLGDEHVAQLQVPVEEPDLVGVVDRVAHGRQHTHVPPQRVAGHRVRLAQRAVLVHEVAPELAGDVPHDDDRVAVPIRREQVDRDDGGVLQRGQDARLAEQLPRVLGRAVVLPQRLQGDVSPQRPLGRGVDLGHPSPSELVAEVHRHRQVGQVRLHPRGLVGDARLLPVEASHLAEQRHGLGEDARLHAQGLVAREQRRLVVVVEGPAQRAARRGGGFHRIGG